MMSLSREVLIASSAGIIAIASYALSFLKNPEHDSMDGVAAIQLNTDTLPNGTLHTMVNSLVFLGDKLAASDFKVF